MLAFLSDLHFSDGTAAIGDASPDLFRLAIGDVYAMAEELAKKRDRPTRLDIVLLGDIFDLLRTERWFEDRHGNAIPLAERPWGTPAQALDTGALSPAAAAHARAILAETVEKNAAALAALRGDSAPPPPGVDVRRIYVPGNHDRLYLHDDALRDGIRAALGATDGAALGEEGIHLHRIESPDHGVLARHGHEGDPWSFPRYRRDAAPADHTDADYRPAPISDAIITEMAARLPYELAGRLLETRAFGAHEAARVHQSMKRIEDVRPIFAAFHWAYYEVERIGAHLGEPRARILRTALDDSLRAMARAFRDLPFYQAWDERRHVPFLPDAAFLLRIILCAMSSINAPLRKVAEIVERAIVFFDPRDVGLRGAAREDLGVVGDRHMRFVVYGHTHHPTQTPLRGRVRTRDVYLNTGTYRPGVFRAESGGFVGWQRLAYVVLSSAEEARSGAGGGRAPDGGPAFVSWIGGRSAETPRRVVGARRAV